MTASRLKDRGHVIPAQTDHLEVNGGVIGPAIIIGFHLCCRSENRLRLPNFDRQLVDHDTSTNHGGGKRRDGTL
jgi:hypothetical protein